MFSGFLTRIILYALIVGACFAYVSALQNRAVRSELALADYIAKVGQETAVREAENKVKQQTLQADYEKNYKAHLEQLKAVLTNGMSLLDKERLKNANLQNQLDFIAGERDILRNDIRAIAGLSEGQGNATDSSAIGRECDATAFDTLKRACMITTADFNACRQAFDDNCALTGCE